jgi:hypothetical protein
MTVSPQRNCSRQGVVQGLRENQDDARNCGGNIVSRRDQELRCDGILPAGEA